LTDKNDNPEPNPDSSQPDPAEDAASSSDQDNVAGESVSEEWPHPENLAAKPGGPEPAPASKSSFSFIPLLLILVLAAGGGGGGYWVYEEQKKLHQEVQAGFNQMASRLDTVEADMQRLQNNQQELETFNRSLQGHQSEVAEAFQSHQNSLSTLDEDVIRLKEELNRLAESQAAQPAAGGDRGDNTQPEPAASPARDQSEIEANEESEEPVELAEGQAVDPASAVALPTRPAAGDNTPGQTAEANDRSQEAQEYIDFVESTTGKFFRLVKEGFVNMWQWFASLF